MKKILNVALVDDHQLFRNGLSSLLKGYKQINIVFEACCGTDLFDKLKTNIPDIILLDINMPGMDGFVVTPLVRKKYPNCKILILSFYYELGLITRLINEGANGFLNKDSSIETVVNALECINEKGYYLDGNTLKAISKNFNDNSTRKNTFHQAILSPREIEIVKLICRQHTIREIAEILAISPRTVETYKNNIYSKTESKNVAGVVLHAVKHNLID